ncbi:hypothetical protein TrCOL_g1377 [Triparma columacea]|uniref:Uncharacterized protein n=1 Tax=Triparma columacea TaxID=722753 RepID=A0A9W7LEX1_9STRA|nr:hypothetical protein TrCOL_g1377 [Triparma columacea]
MPSAFSRRRSRPANLAGGYVASSAPPSRSSRSQASANPPHPSSGTPSTTATTLAGSAGRPDQTVDLTPQSIDVAARGSDVGASSTSPSTPTPSVQALATKTIEKKFRKSQLASAWEKMNPPLTTEERVKGVIRRASLGATATASPFATATATATPGGRLSPPSATDYISGGRDYGGYGVEYYKEEDDDEEEEVVVVEKEVVEEEKVVEEEEEERRGAGEKVKQEDEHDEDDKIYSSYVSPRAEARELSTKGGAEEEEYNQTQDFHQTQDFTASAASTLNLDASSLRVTSSGLPVTSSTTPFTIAKREARLGRAERTKESQGQAQRQVQGSALHMSDMIVGGQNCMIDHEPPLPPKSATKLHTMRSTFQSSLHDPRPDRNSLTRAEIMQNPVSAFKEQRETLISDMSELWRQIDFLEVELQKAHKKNLTMSSRNRALVEKLASEVRSNRSELEVARQKGLNDDDRIRALCKDLGLANAEKRRLHHLATTKNLAQKKTGERVAQIAADKLTRLNKIKNLSDMRGDDLASMVVDLRRQHTSAEGTLMSEIHDLKGTVHVLKTELRLKSEAHESSSERTRETIRKNDELTDEFNRMQESLRIAKKVKEKDDATVERLRNQISQNEHAKDRAMGEWRERCLRAERGEAYASQHLMDREKELDKLREKLAGSVNDAEGEVRVSRAEAEALKERCIALEEQNEALVDRYREAEVIMRKEGVRFDGTMKRLVDEMRARDDLGREFLEERKLLNKQWEKREKEIVMALKREARKVELKDELLKQKDEEISGLQLQVSSLADDDRRGVKRGAASPSDLRGGGEGGTSDAPGAPKLFSYPLLPSELESKVGMLRVENDRLRRENEKLLQGYMDKSEGGRVADDFRAKEVMPSATRSRGRMDSLRGSPLVGDGGEGGEGGEGDNDTLGSSTNSDRQASELYEAFKSGGVGRMTSEVRKMVSESGKILGKIQMLEGMEGGEEVEGGGGDGGGNMSVETSAFMSPYLFKDT